MQLDTSVVLHLPTPSLAHPGSIHARCEIRVPARGFTLIEMLAVLTLAALMTGVTVPAMQRWFDSISQRAQLSEIAVQFQKLSARSALLSQTVSLEKTSWRGKLGDGEPALSLPEGWSLVNEQPIIFFHSGLCSGGDIDLVGPQSRKVQLRIAPMTCDVSVVK